MKFHRARHHAKLFGRQLAETLPYLTENTLVVSVPTASSRVRRRGFDQAELIARHFARARQLSYQSLLVRTSKVDLIGKSRHDRIQLMHSSMAYRGKPLAGANILLIDDVLTTGATLEASAALLRSHGARHVDAAVVAH